MDLMDSAHLPDPTATFQSARPASIPDSMGPTMGQGEMWFTKSLHLRDEYRTHLEEDSCKTSPPLAPVAEPVSMKTQSQISGWKVTAKESLKVAGQFMQMLLKRVPRCVTANLVQMALSITKVILEIKDVGWPFLSWALADYYIRQLKATKMSLYNVSKKQQADS